MGSVDRFCLMVYNVQRIYVHEKVYDEFVSRFVELTKVGPIPSWVASNIDQIYIDI